MLGAPDVPVVRIILGDNNLLSVQAREALQQDNNQEPVWHVYHSLANLRGDNVAVSGAEARFKPIPIGKSFAEPGLTRDPHDVVAVAITLGAASQPEAKKRRVLERPEDSDSDGDGDEAPAAEGVKQRAGKLHQQLQKFWEQKYTEVPFSPELVDQLGRLLFIRRNRKSTEPAEEDVRAFESKEETLRVITSALQLRQTYLQSKGITDLDHELTNEERQELVRSRREVYEKTRSSLLFRSGM